MQFVRYLGSGRVLYREGEAVLNSGAEDMMSKL